MPYFELQPDQAELQQLAEEYWEQAGEKERQLEREAFEAGKSIREGEYTLANLEAIVRWKSERIVHYLIANSREMIQQALEVAAKPTATVQEAVGALMSLRGVDLGIASAILSAIYPDRYAVLDYRTLEGLGHERQDVEFYRQYLEYVQLMSGTGALTPQEGMPGPTTLHAFERALWAWSMRNASEARQRELAESAQ